MFGRKEICQTQKVMNKQKFLLFWCRRLFKILFQVTLRLYIKAWSRLKVNKTSRRLPQTERDPTEHPCSRRILTSTQGHMGRRTVVAGGSIGGGGAPAVPAKSRRSHNLCCFWFGEASVGRDRWEREQRHLVPPWRKGHREPCSLRGDAETCSREQLMLFQGRSSRAILRFTMPLRASEGKSVLKWFQIHQNLSLHRRLIYKTGCFIA